MKQMNIRIPDELREMLRERAFRERTTVTSIVIEALLKLMGGSHANNS